MGDNLKITIYLESVVIGRGNKEEGKRFCINTKENMGKNSRLQTKYLKKLEKRNMEIDKIKEIIKWEL